MKRITYLLICAVILCGIISLTGCDKKESDNRTQIVVMSDTHLGVDDAYAEIGVNKQALLEFLTMIRSSSTTSELVINGDFIDYWFLPADYEMPDTLSEFDDLVVKNNQDIFDMIKAIISDGQIKLTYVPGNHDTTFNEAEVQRIFPGINQARDSEGVGTYIAGDNQEIAIEHGHRYNIFCAPDPLSNRDMVNSTTAIMPAGYFFTRIATTSVVEGKPATTNTFPQITLKTNDETQKNYYQYYKIWVALLANLPISESFSEDIIKTNIDGYTKNISVNDLLPYQNEDGTISLNLYDGIVENWQERQKINKVNVLINAADAIVGAPTTEATDEQAQAQYFNNDSSQKVVVFGHTHVAKIVKSTNLKGENVIYANSGTWIEKNYDNPSRTYLIITPATDDSDIKVSLYQYSEDGTSTLLQEEIIAN